jgi:hypothetical protein
MFEQKKDFDEFSIPMVKELIKVKELLLGFEQSLKDNKEFTKAIFNGVAKSYHLKDIDKIIALKMNQDKE